MLPHDEAIYLYTTSLERFLSDVEISRLRYLIDNNRSSDNIVAMCQSALHHTGAIDLTPPTHTYKEWGSWYYDWWTMAAMCTLPQCQPYCRAWAAWHRLHLRHVEEIEFVRPLIRNDVRSRFTMSGMDRYQGRLAVVPGARQLWSLYDVPAVERGVAGRVLTGGGGLNFDHAQLGWSAEILRGRLGVFDSERGDLGNTSVRGGQTFWLWTSRSGDYLSVARLGYGGTRGPIGAVRYDAGRRRVILYTTSSIRPGSRAEWYTTTSTVDEGRGIVTMESDHGAHLDIDIPEFDELIVWRGDDVMLPSEPTPEPPQEEDPRVRQALLLLDAALVGGTLEKESRTCAEVLRRCIRGDRRSAHTGSVTLERMLR